MPGGKGKINEYNKSLTAEERKKNAKTAGSSPKKKPSLPLIRDITKKIIAAPAPDSLKDTLAEFGLEGEDLTIAAGIAFAVVRAALEGDLKAVEKVERYTGQYINEREDLENKLLKAKAKAVNKNGGVEPVVINITPRSGDDNATN